ncbi:phage virion morphogenesis protein [Methylophilus sp. DW102]|uniref:phage virion morphogenesis protein n=1 Tax=Methylophilus sp. DW102 TaxID=3095607 RepID=UPI0030932D9A|nr:phage virion morphogenesis protein [Methylophilus sp. DW102]
MQLVIDYQDISVKHLVAVLSHEFMHPQMLLGSIGESLLRVNQERHLASLAPDGSEWAPLKESSKLEKRKGGPLNKTGEMLQSFNYQVDANSLLMGFDGQWNAQRAYWHNKGTDPYEIKPKNGKALKFGDHIVKKVNHPGLPARELIGYPDNDQRMVDDVVNDHLMAVLNRV